MQTFKWYRIDKIREAYYNRYPCDSVDTWDLFEDALLATISQQGPTDEEKKDEKSNSKETRTKAIHEGMG